MNIDPGNEAILRTQCAQIYKDKGIEAVLTMLIEMFESTKILGDKLGELTEKDDPLISLQMKTLSQYHGLAIPPIVLMRDKIHKHRENLPPFKGPDYTGEDTREGIGDE